MRTVRIKFPPISLESRFYLDERYRRWVTSNVDWSCPIEENIKASKNEMYNEDYRFFSGWLAEKKAAGYSQFCPTKRIVFSQLQLKDCSEPEVASASKG